MKPGRELDALIAEKVMEWKRLTYAQASPTNPNYANDHRLTTSWHDSDLKEMALAEDNTDYYTPEDAWSPSTCIGQAWEAAERSGLFRTQTIQQTEGGWWIGNDYNSCHAETAPHAICLAALKAVGA